MQIARILGVPVKRILVSGHHRKHIFWSIGVQTIEFKNSGVCINALFTLTWIRRCYRTRSYSILTGIESRFHVERMASFDNLSCIFLATFEAVFSRRTSVNDWNNRAWILLLDFIAKTIPYSCCILAKRLPQRRRVGVCLCVGLTLHPYYS